MSSPPEMVAERQVIELCRELVRIPSLPREEREVAEAICRHMLGAGFDETWIDDMGNVVGRVGTGAGPRVLFDGHMDTVGVSDPAAWHHDPFGGDVVGGRLYGRGSSDMKGALAAMIVAAGSLGSGRHRLKGTVYVSATVCEELVEGPGLGRVIEQVCPDGVVIGESTGLALYIGQRGRAELVLEVQGVPAHSSTPHLGVNAVRHLAALLPAIDSLPMTEDPLLGPTLIELTDIISRPYPGISVVPDLCRATFDRRLLVGETLEGIVAQLAEACAADATRARAHTRVSLAEARFTTYTGYEVAVPKFAPAWKTPEDHPLVKSAQVGLAAAGLGVRLGAYGFCTNGSYSAGKYNIPTIGFGPADEAQAHTVDEYVEIGALLAATRGYRSIAAAVCGGG